MQTLEDELDSRCDFGRRGATGRPAVGPIATVERTKLPDGVGEAGHFAHPADVLAGRYPLAGLHHEAAFERGHDLVQVVQREPLVEGREERLCDQSLDDALLGRFIADRFELDLAGCGRDHGAKVGHAWRAHILTKADGSLERRCLEDLRVGDRHSDAHTAALADLGCAAREVRQLDDQLLHECGRHDRGNALLGREAQPLLANDRHLVVERMRVVGADL